MATYNISINLPPTIIPSVNTTNNIPQVVRHTQTNPINIPHTFVPPPPSSVPPVSADRPRGNNNNSNNNFNRRINFSNGDNLSGMIEILSYNNPQNPFNIDNFTNNIINSLGRNNISTNNNQNRGLTLTEIRENTELLNHSETDQNIICNICREPLVSNNQHTILRKINNCGHIFHQSCIDMWLEDNNQCPNCRRHIVPNETTTTNTTNTNTNTNTTNTTNSSYIDDIELDEEERIQDELINEELQDELQDVVNDILN